MKNICEWENCNENGDFKADFKIFNGPGGLSESKRLNVPLLGSIPLDPELSLSIDHGTPFILKHSSTSAGKEFIKISNSINKKLNLNEN